MSSKLVAARRIAVTIPLVFVMVVPGSAALADEGDPAPIYPASGGVWGWGTDIAGIPDTGTGGYVESPTQMPNLQDMVDVQAGNAAAYALDPAGEVWAWGNNGHGELGDGTTTSRSVPGKVLGVADVVSLVAIKNGSTVFAVTSDGSVWSWGDSYLGQTGRGISSDPLSTPAVIAGLPPVAELVATSGAQAVAARTVGGEVWVWGNTNKEWGPSGGWQTPYPMRIEELSDVISISCDPYFGALYAVESDGSVWAAGEGYGGAFGDGVDSPASRVPVQIPLVEDAVKVFGTYEGAYAVTSDGGMWAWGLGTFLTDPAGSTTTYPTPFKPELPADVVDVVTVGGIAYAIMSDGSLWAWGQNAHGEVGDGTKVWADAPVQVQGLTGVVKVASTNYTAYAIRSDGTLWTWGRNDNRGFETGDPAVGDLTVPTHFPGLTGVSAIFVWSNSRWIVADSFVDPGDVPDPMGWNLVHAETRVVGKSFVATDDEQTATYSFDFILDDFPEPCGACRVRVYDGAGKLMGDASITQGGSVHFSGTDTIGGSTHYTQERISRFFALVTLSAGDPATTYGSQYIPIDFGWRSPEPEAREDLVQSVREGWSVLLRGQGHDLLARRRLQRRLRIPAARRYLHGRCGGRVPRWFALPEQERVRGTLRAPDHQHLEYLTVRRDRPYVLPRRDEAGDRDSRFVRCGFAAHSARDDRDPSQAERSPSDHRPRDYRHTGGREAHPGHGARLRSLVDHARPREANGHREDRKHLVQRAASWRTTPVRSSRRPESTR